MTPSKNQKLIGFRPLFYVRKDSDGFIDGLAAADSGFLENASMVNLGKPIMKTIFIFNFKVIFKVKLTVKRGTDFRPEFTTGSSQKWSDRETDFPGYPTPT